MAQTYNFSTYRMTKETLELDGITYDVTKIWNLEGVLTSERWGSGRKPHRVDGPAHRTWSGTGAPLSEMWYRHGILHRQDGPALQTWSVYGQQLLEWWRLDGREMTTGEIDSILRPENIMEALREGLPQPIYEEIIAVYRAV